MPDASDALPSVPYDLDANEWVSRFLYATRHYSVQKGRPKPGAFDPPPDGELSTAHTTDLPDSEIWAISRLTLGTQPGRSRVYARVEIPVAELLKRNLFARRDDDPFPRHTTVVGWSQADDENDRKAKIKEVCVSLSACPEVMLVIAAQPIT
jgi:hypothetical protein